MQARRYVFTLNNYVEEDVFSLQNNPHVRYIRFAKEIGNGTPHLQGYFTLPSPQRTAWLKKKISNRAHFEAMKGTLAENDAYIEKEGGEIYEAGDKPLEGSDKSVAMKQRYADAWSKAKEGNIEEVDADLRLRFYPTLKKIRADYQGAAGNQEFENWWFVGPTGTGKSYTARENWPDAYIKNLNKWWDGYEGQETVIIEEWHPDAKVLGHYLKIWSDRYAFRGEVKGASAMMNPRRIVVTSNYEMDECFEFKDLEPLKRRFKVRRFEDYPEIAGIQPGREPQEDELFDLFNF